MEVLEMILITLQITTAFAKKKHKIDRHTSSDESIENLLYYKDCKYKKPTTINPLMLRAAEQKPACPCPRMCCSMCCECDAPSPFVGRQMAPLQQSAVEPMQVAPQPARPPNMPVQPQIVQRGAQKKKKMKMKPDPMLPPIGGRRDYGFTRENIKSLIAQDQDIKKILKDLVRVTMHKVDLVEKSPVNQKASKFKAATKKPEIEEEEDYND